MNFKTLMTIQTIAECGKVTTAAEKLHISQPALSRTIRETEEELGFKIFDHEKNLIKVNSNGRRYISMASEILNRYSKTVAEIQEDNGIYSRELQLEYSSAGTLIANLCYDFKKIYGDTNITLKDRKLQMDRKTNFCFYSTVKREEGSDSVFLAKEKLFLTCSRNNPLARNDSVYLSTLASMPFLIAGANSDNNILQKYFCDLAGFEPKESNMVEKMQTLLTLVELDMGITILPTIESPKILQIPILDFDCARYIHLKRNEVPFHTKRAKEFEDFTISYFDSLILDNPEIYSK